MDTYISVIFSEYSASAYPAVTIIFIYRVRTIMMNNSCDAVLKSSVKRYSNKIESTPFYETFSKNLQVLLKIATLILVSEHITYHRHNVYFLKKLS